MPNSPPANRFASCSAATFCSVAPIGCARCNRRRDQTRAGNGAYATSFPRSTTSTRLPRDTNSLSRDYSRYKAESSLLPPHYEPSDQTTPAAKRLSRPAQQAIRVIGAYSLNSLSNSAHGHPRCNQSVNMVRHHDIRPQAILPQISCPSEYHRLHLLSDFRHPQPQRPTIGFVEKGFGPSESYVWRFFVVPHPCDKVCRQRPIQSPRHKQHRSLGMPVRKITFIVRHRSDIVAPTL